MVAGGLLLAGCVRATAPASQKPSAQEAYLSPPLVVSAVHAPGGAVRLLGSAPAGSDVILRTPDGGGASAMAGPNGDWAVDLPAADAPRLFAIQADLPGRALKGEGALAVLPAPAIPAIVLRAGFAALPSGAVPSERLEVIAFDYDGGGAAVGGFAPAGAPIRLLIDGGVVGATKAGSDGRFAIVAVDPRRGVPPGSHLIRVETGTGQAVERTVEVAQPELPADRVYSVERGRNGWRLTWRTPGGGLQTSLVFDPALGGTVR